MPKFLLTFLTGSFDNSLASHFGTVEFANTGDSVRFMNPATIQGPITTVTPFAVGGPGPVTLTSSTPATFNGAFAPAVVYLAGANMDLGPKYASPTVYVRGAVRLMENMTIPTVYVDQGASNLILNGRTLHVTGRLYVPGAWNGGMLTMNTVLDSLILENNFEFDGRDGSVFSAGTMVLRGASNWWRNTSSNNVNFRPTGSHKVVFQGSGPQTVTFVNLNASWLRHVDFANSADSVRLMTGVRFDGTVNALTPRAVGGPGTAVLLSAPGTLVGAFAPRVTVLAGRMSIAHDLGSDTLYVHDTVSLTGNASMRNVIVDVQAGNITPNGNTLRVLGRLWYKNAWGSGVLTMTNAADSVVVEGNLEFDGRDGSSLTNGTLVLRGASNWFRNTSSNNENFRASGAHRMVLDGSQVQTVTVDNMNATWFNNVSVSNTNETRLATNVRALGGLEVRTAGKIVIPSPFTFTMNGILLRSGSFWESWGPGAVSNSGSCVNEGATVITGSPGC